MHGKTCSFARQKKNEGLEWHERSRINFAEIFPILLIVFQMIRSFGLSSTSICWGFAILNVLMLLFNFFAFPQTSTDGLIKWKTKLKEANEAMDHVRGDLLHTKIKLALCLDIVTPKQVQRNGNSLASAKINDPPAVDTSSDIHMQSSNEPYLIIGIPTIPRPNGVDYLSESISEIVQQMPKVGHAYYRRV